MFVNFDSMIRIGHKSNWGGGGLDLDVKIMRTEKIPFECLVIWGALRAVHSSRAKILQHLHEK